MFAYAAPGLPRLQIRSGREVIVASSVRPVERGVSTREGGVCCFALRFFFFFLGVEVVDEAVATDVGESARTGKVALSVATASCRESVDNGFHSEIVSQSTARVCGDVIFDIFQFAFFGFVSNCYLLIVSRDWGLMYLMTSKRVFLLHHRCWLVESPYAIFGRGLDAILSPSIVVTLLITMCCCTSLFTLDSIRHLLLHGVPNIAT